MKKLTVLLASYIFSQASIAQRDIDSVLSQVERNNRSLQANMKYWEAKQAGYKTGLTPYDPQVDYDYMIGSPAIAGNQRDFAITQRLDFPTVYKRKKDLSGQQIVQSVLQQQAYRQSILLEAKLMSLHAIYLNRKGAELDRRLKNTERILEGLKKKLDQGDIIILDMNKAKLQLLNIRHEVNLNENEKILLLSKLTELNGGTPVSVNDTAYPYVPVFPEFKVLDSTIEANDPVMRVFEQDIKIFEQQLSVQKAMNLPKIEAGYHSQGILGQSYKGIHTGITVPLWENKNKVTAFKSDLDHAISNAEALRIKHRYENRQYFEQLDVRRKMIDEYKELLTSLNNTALLNKALDLGSITVIQYFYDESFYFSAYDRLLMAEWEYHQAVAKLNRYLL
jgi:cobalt-zinc-cadmium efflux system outer membrane protein